MGIPKGAAFEIGRRMYSAMDDILEVIKEEKVSVYELWGVKTKSFLDRQDDDLDEVTDDECDL